MIDGLVEEDKDRIDGSNNFGPWMLVKHKSRRKPRDNNHLRADSLGYKKRRL